MNPAFLKKGSTNYKNKPLVCIRGVNNNSYLKMKYSCLVPMIMYLNWFKVPELHLFPFVQALCPYEVVK